VSRLFVLMLGGLLWMGEAHADSVLRVACEDADAGAAVYVNGQFKGECPLDAKVKAGTVQLRVTKTEDADRERVFEQTLNLGDDIAKKVQVVLGNPQLTEQGLAKQQAEQERQKERRQQGAIMLASWKQAAMAEAAKRQADILAEFKAKGIEPGNGKSFRDCPDCPEMVLVPAGAMDMGSANGRPNEQPRHLMVFPFVMAVSKYEVTQKQWKAIMGANPSENSGLFTDPDKYPVEQVNLLDAFNFAAQLNKKTGKYYRLPTEAEWEYACRAGTDQQFCGSNDAGRVGWHAGNGERETHQIGKLAPNGWGLYDMSGNVWEWVGDVASDRLPVHFYGHSYWMPDPKSATYMGRGGAYNEQSTFLTSTSRTPFQWDLKHAAIGFRVVREVSDFAWPAKRGRFGLAGIGVIPERAMALGLKNLNGAQIQSTHPGLPADQAGIKSGDVVLEYNGKPIVFPTDLTYLIFQTAPGTTVPVKIAREGSGELTVNVTVVEAK